MFNFSVKDFTIEDLEGGGMSWVATLLLGQILSVSYPQVAYASGAMKTNEIYEIGELFDLGIQLLYLILLLGLLGVGTYFVIRQVLVRRELDLSAKELQVKAIAFFHFISLITDFAVRASDIGYLKTSDSNLYYFSLKICSLCGLLP